MAKQRRGFWSRTCAFLLKIFGWQIVGEPAPEKNAVILVAPHTSLWDFVLPYLFYTSVGETPHALVKKEMFFWPLGPILRKLGGIPIDRSNATATMKGVIDTMRNTKKKFHIAIAPEGTRKPVKRWKTGYHTFATVLECPVYLGWIDYAKKQISVGNPFPLSGDPRVDTDNIQKEYLAMNKTGKHPERFIA